MNKVNDGSTMAFATIGTIASWSFSGTLSVLATLCTLIVAGPGAYKQIKAWYDAVAPKIAAKLLEWRS